MSTAKKKVRLLFSTVGAKRGSVLEVSAEEAERLAREGHAVPVEEPKKQDPKS